MNGVEACFTGRLGRDAELRHVKGGELAMVAFTAAVDQQHQGEDHPPTWIRVAVFGELAETMAERLVKGTRVYCEGRLEVSLWEPGDGRSPRININMTATSIAPMGQIGRQRPKPTRTAERGARTWDRARDAGRTRAAGEAVLAAANSPARRVSEPPQSWIDDSADAIRDLEGRR